MGTSKRKIQKLFCVFFVGFFIMVPSMNFFTTEVNAKALKSPIYVDGKRVKDANGVYVQSHYQLFLKSYDPVRNTALYTIGCWWNFEGNTILYSDNLYVNGSYVGTFSGNNGKVNGTVERGQWFNITLRGGINSIKTTNVNGVGGEFNETIWLDDIGSAPVVHGKDGTWFAGEVGNGKRTWQSLYTDGATGSSEGNKVQTSTGFLYSDPDECQTPVNAYHSSTIGKNSTITKILDSSGRNIYGNNWTIPTQMNSVGIFTVYSETTDSGGMKGSGSRVIRVVPYDPPTIQGQELWFYQDETITNEKLLEKVKAHDKVQGDISSLARIKQSNVQSGVIGDYHVTYVVTNDLGLSAETTVQVHIMPRITIQNSQTMYLRFIDAPYHQTLQTSSVWRSGTHKAVLERSLYGNNTLEIWTLDTSDIEAIQAFNQTHDYSEASNQAFYEMFAHLRN